MWLAEAQIADQLRSTLIKTVLRKIRLLDVILLTYLVVYELNHCLEIPQQSPLEMIRQKLWLSSKNCEAPFPRPLQTGESLPVSFVRENAIGHAMQMILITQALFCPVREAWSRNANEIHHASTHTTPEKFENVALFLRLGLPSTLLRHENSAFRPEEFKKINIFENKFSKPMTIIMFPPPQIQNNPLIGDLRFEYEQEPITRSLQLPHIPVTAFSQTDLFLV